MFFRVSLCCLAAFYLATGCKPSAALHTLPKPAFADSYQSTRNKALVEKLGAPTGQVKFVVTSEEASSLADLSTWFADNKLILNSKAYHDGAVLAPLRDTKLSQDWTKYRTTVIGKQTLQLAQVIEQDDIALLIYGSAPNEMHVITDTWALVIRDKKSGEVKHSFDFSNFGMAPEYVHREKDFVFQDILWAQVEDGILYVSHAHWTYAESSKSMNAYVTAIDLSKSEIMWRSRPLVSNAANFAIVGNFIVTGYSFTLENSMLYALHKSTGDVAGSIELEAKNTDKKFIEYIISKGTQLYIHAFDKKYVVQMSY